jgi:FlaG/FlaF family flagellin (archaellin)
MFRKLAGDKRGVDTIIATVLMVAIVVAASVMVFVYSTGLFGALTRAPNLQKELLSLEFSNFGPQNPTYNVTLYLRNTGSVPVTLVAYYVKSNSSQYARSTWAGATITPTSLGQAQILIAGACNCTNIGGAFTFTTGSSYTITMLSSRGTQFTFSVVRYS